MISYPFAKVASRSALSNINASATSVKANIPPTHTNLSTIITAIITMQATICPIPCLLLIITVPATKNNMHVTIGLISPSLNPTLVIITTSPTIDIAPIKVATIPTIREKRFVNPFIFLSPWFCLSLSCKKLTITQMQSSHKFNQRPTKPFYYTPFAPLSQYP